VLAIAPGIRVLAYAVMRFERHQLRATVVDYDVMHHTIRGYSLSSQKELMARANVHWLSLSVCLERYVPDVVVLGPSAQRSEAQNNAEACRRIIRTATIALSVPTLEYQTDREMVEDLGIGQRDLRDLVGRVVESVPSNRFAVRTLASGVAGAVQMLDLRKDILARETEE
jgi:hypothetical protein